MSETIGGWTLFNGGGAVLREDCTLEEVRDYMTPERFARGWNAVYCINVTSQAQLDAVMEPATDAALTNAYAEGRKDEREEWALSVHDVLAERQRQVEAEGYTPDHDDDHRAGDLTDAAMAYIDRSAMRWPWDEASFKPRDRRRDLVRAAALILAEIDRLDRVRGEGWER